MCLYFIATPRNQCANQTFVNNSLNNFTSGIICWIIEWCNRRHSSYKLLLHFHHQQFPINNSCLENFPNYHTEQGRTARIVSWISLKVAVVMQSRSTTLFELHLHCSFIVSIRLTKVPPSLTCVQVNRKLRAEQPGILEETAAQRSSDERSESIQGEYRRRGAVQSRSDTADSSN